MKLDYKNLSFADIINSGLEDVFYREKTRLTFQKEVILMFVSSYPEDTGFTCFELTEDLIKYHKSRGLEFTLNQTSMYHIIKSFMECGLVRCIDSNYSPKLGNGQRYAGTDKAVVFLQCLDVYRGSVYDYIAERDNL